MDEIHGFLTAKFLYENALAYGVDTDLDFIIADDPEYAYKYARYILKQLCAVSVRDDSFSCSIHLPPIAFFA